MGTVSGKINVERGAEGVLAREKHGTTKTGGDTGPIRGGGAESMSKLVLVLKQSYPMSN